MYSGEQLDDHAQVGEDPGNVVIVAGMFEQDQLASVPGFARFSTVEAQSKTSPCSMGRLVCAASTETLEKLKGRARGRCI